MSQVLNPRTLLQEAVFYFKENQLISKLVALNIFSTVIFFTVENTLFRWWFGMTLSQSIQARELGMLFNTTVGISWPMIDEFFRRKFSNHRRKWLRDKWEEMALLTVKIIVNGFIYVIVGLSSGHFAFDFKLLCKVVIIVMIAYFGADFLKYRMTPWIGSILNQISSFFQGTKSDRQTEPIFVVNAGDLNHQQRPISAIADNANDQMESETTEVVEEGSVVLNR